MKLDLTAEELLALYNRLLQDKNGRKYEEYDDADKGCGGCCRKQDGPARPEDVLDRVLSKVEARITTTIASADAETLHTGARRSFQQWEATQKAKLAELEELEKHPLKKVEKEIENLGYKEAEPGVFIRIDESPPPEKPKRKKR